MSTERRLKVIEVMLARVLHNQGIIMATQAELTATLNKINDQLIKIGKETTSLLAAIEELKGVIANGPVSPELQAAVNKVAEQAQVVDDLVPDAPTP